MTDAMWALAGLVINLTFFGVLSLLVLVGAYRNTRKEKYGTSEKEL